MNAGVAKHKYLGTYLELRYPSIGNIVQAVKEVGPSALMFKVDISRAFKHLKNDPRDLDLLGPCHNKYFMDLCLLGSGLEVLSPSVVQMPLGILWLLRPTHYIDDLVYIGLPDEICNAYSYLLNLHQ